MTPWKYIVKLIFLHISNILMQKRIKITLYIILILIIVAVIWLMSWKKNTRTQTPTNTNIEISTWEDIIDNNEWNTINLENTDTFEEDVMNDLEWFFNDNNWYEDVEWEYWFINADGE